MDHHDIVDIAQVVVDTFTAEFVWLVIQVVIIGVLVLLAKALIEAIVEYSLFRFDSHVCTGTSVEVYGEKGQICRANLFFIVIEVDDGWIRVPTRDWRRCKYRVLRQESSLLKRRSEDQ